MDKCKLAVTVAAMSVAMGITASAGQWKADGQGWWYDRGNGTWPVNAWEWIDGNGDGIAECYYFDGRGYCLLNTITPDNHVVDGNGAWMVNGMVQTQAASTGGNAVGKVQDVSYVGVYGSAGWRPGYNGWSDEYMPLGIANPAIRIDSHSGGIIQGYYYDGSTGGGLDTSCDFKEAVDSSGHFRKVLPEQGYEFVLDFYLRESKGKKTIELKTTVVKYANFDLVADSYAKAELEYDYYNGTDLYEKYD